MSWLALKMRISLLPRQRRSHLPQPPGHRHRLRRALRHRRAPPRRGLQSHHSRRPCRHRSKKMMKTMMMRTLLHQRHQSVPPCRRGRSRDLRLLPTHLQQRPLPPSPQHQRGPPHLHRNLQQAHWERQL